MPRLLEKSGPPRFFFFDLLYADGYDLRGVPLDDRKRLLKTLVVPDEQIRLSEAFDAQGEEVFAAARQMGLEGIVAKDRKSSYEGARSTRWQKVKVSNEQEFVIAGFTEGEREYFGALVLAIREDGKLRHVGQVGTGFDNNLMRAIYQHLEPLITKTSPLQPKPKIKGVTWVRPEVICQVRFLEWTQDGILRAPVFVGLREDREAEEVTRETPSDQGSEPSGLNLSGKETTAEVDGHSLKLTNLDKVFFPKDGWKKRDLLNFL